MNLQCEYTGTIASEYIVFCSPTLFTVIKGTFQTTQLHDLICHSIATQRIQDRHYLKPKPNKTKQSQTVTLFVIYKTWIYVNSGCAVLILDYHNIYLEVSMIYLPICDISCHIKERRMCIRLSFE